jgi:hypothetical protein
MAQPAIRSTEPQHGEDIDLHEFGECANRHSAIK